MTRVVVTVVMTRCGEENMSVSGKWHIHKHLEDVTEVMMGFDVYEYVAILCFFSFLFSFFLISIR